MTSAEFAANILLNLPYEPNQQQIAVAGALARYCVPSFGHDAVFVLNGYAGTGKTSLMGALVRTLPQVGYKSVLLAPTGRAAKVFGSYSDRTAYTIHRRIYKHNAAGVNTPGVNIPATNHSNNTVFIVDEASMIGAADSSGNSLLLDLVQYVFAGTGNRLILLGDTAQLPPVGAQRSPAMNPEVLRQLGLKVSRATLTATARQGRDSGILYNATMLRRTMLQEGDLPFPNLKFNGFSDVVAVSPEDLPELLDSSYNNAGLDNTIVITRSNRSAVEFNHGIRGQVLYYEDELRPEDLLTVTKNNYYWTKDVPGLDFVANGDILRVHRILGQEQKWGFRFADVLLGTLDGSVEFTAKLMLETLHSEAPSMSQERSNELYYAIMQDPEQWRPDQSMDDRARQLKDNPYWSSLQIKYAYAITCHKAQGGQWLDVYVDMSYIPADASSMELYRWLYTAITRARTKLYIIGNRQD